MLGGVKPAHVARATLIAAAATLPPLALSCVRPTILLCVGGAALAASLLADAARFTSRGKRNPGYFASRLCSMRYLLGAVCPPFALALVVRHQPQIGAIAAIFTNGIIAYRYRLRFEQPGALQTALLPTALGGVALGLECLALSGREWLGGRLLHAEESSQQRIVLVERDGAAELFIDGDLQFRASDEHIYHDGLLAPLARPADVLVLGGGDGLVARDLLRRSSIRRIVIVDWDPVVPRLFRSLAHLTALNMRALHDPRVQVIRQDVRAGLPFESRAFDAIIGDLSDPRPNSDGGFPLSERALFVEARRVLRDDGLLVTHASSADNSETEIAIRRAMESAGFTTRSYERLVPSFGPIAYVVGISFEATRRTSNTAASEITWTG
jgi:predicted membrane-bound spermidine synthase